MNAAPLIASRSTILCDTLLESRFGSLPLEARQSVESLDSYERISELMIAAATAPSLTALGLC